MEKDGSRAQSYPQPSGSTPHRPPGWKATFDPAEKVLEMKIEFTKLERKELPEQNWRAAIATWRYIRALGHQFEEGCEQQLSLTNGGRSKASR